MDYLYEDINGIENDNAEMSDAEIKQQVTRMLGKERVEQMSIDEMIREIN